MAEVSNGVTPDQVTGLISAAFAAQPQTFLNGGVEMTVAQLLANYPAGSDNLFKYARVSDLYGSARSVMICESSAGAFYWRPQRTDYSATAPITSGSMTLTPLLSAPTTVFTGTLSGNVSVTPSVTNAWPGARFEIVANGVMGLLNINLNGLIGGGTVPLLTGSSRIVTYIQGSGWRAG